MSDVQDALKGKLIVGIDLGTTNSGVAIWNEKRDKTIMLEDRDGHQLIPSVVGWDTSQQTWVVGHAAKELGNKFPKNVAYSVKRLIGRWFTDSEVLSSLPELPYKMISGGGKDPLRDVIVCFGASESDGKLQLAASEVSSKVLSKLRQDASDKLGVPLTDLKHAVITVPAYFNVLQRRATIESGRIAGFEGVYILNEPTAAALAYGPTVLGPEERRILVYDLGGGTFDISLLDVSRDEIGYIFYTRVVDGDTHLGGDDIDASIVRWLIAEIEKRYGYPVLPDDQLTRERLRSAGEQAKIELSNTQKNTVWIELPSLDLGSSVPFDARIEITRAQLEECARDVIQRTLRITKRAVRDVAGFNWEQIDEIILVGGQTLMPAVQREVEALTGHKPRVNDRPQLAVALGAAEYAHILSLGQEKFQNNALINVIALPLGIRLEESTFVPLVPANATLPHPSEAYPVTTVEDNQTEIQVEIYQAAREDLPINQCILLGSISMEVQPAPARTPKFEVIFEVQADGTMKVIVTNTKNRQHKVLDIFEGKKILVWRDRIPTLTGEEKLETDQ